MADNFTSNAGSGGITVASDDVGGVHHLRVKQATGRDGVGTEALNEGRVISAASTNGTTIKSSGGFLFGICVVNLNAAVRYLKLYDKSGGAGVPDPATDTPVMTIPIPGNTAGAGVTFWTECGIWFPSGIQLLLTTGAADTNSGAVAANEIFVNLLYA